MAKVGYPGFLMNETYINEDIKSVSEMLILTIFKFGSMVLQLVRLAVVFIVLKYMISFILL